MLTNRLPLKEVHFFPYWPLPFFCFCAITIPDLLLVFLIIRMAKSFVLFIILKLNSFNFIK